jgi:hypothetical protein
MHLLARALLFLTLLGSISTYLHAAPNDSQSGLTRVRITNVPYALFIPSQYFSGNQAVSLEGKEIDQLEFMLRLPRFDVHSLGIPTFAMRSLEDFDFQVSVKALRGQINTVTIDGKNFPIDPHSLINYYIESYELIREQYGLRCYALKPYKGSEKNVGLTCIGYRSNGELLLLEGGSYATPTRCASSCSVSYYSDQNQLLVRYEYSQIHLSKWREIDDAVWVHLKSWRSK